MKQPIILFTLACVCVLVTFFISANEPDPPPHRPSTPEGIARIHRPVKPGICPFCGNAIAPPNSQHEKCLELHKIFVSYHQERLAIYERELAAWRKRNPRGLRCGSKSQKVFLKGICMKKYEVFKR